MMKDLIELINACAREVYEQQPAPGPLALDAQTELFGERGIFDSLGLVNLVVAVEQAVEDHYRISVSLADRRALSQRRSPFRTIGSLAEYTQALIQEKS